jgi:hypothetical protein
MLVATGGQERTEREFEGLLTKAGFRMTRVIPPPPPSVFSVVEATPA